jgi:hypothetical protein
MSSFKINSLYACLNGSVVEVLNFTTSVGYETLVCSDGKHRYNRSTHSEDAGRVTGSPHDYSCEFNFLKENAEVPEGTTHYRNSFDGGSYKNTYYKKINGEWFCFCEWLSADKQWQRANNQTMMNNESSYKNSENNIIVIADELALQERNNALFLPKNEDEEYQEFLKQNKIESQLSCRDTIFSESSKEFYESALALLTNEPQPFSELKEKVNQVTGLDDAWAILSGLVQAGLARQDEIDFTMQGKNIKKNVKYSYQLA